MQATTIELLVAGMAFEAALADHLRARLTPAQMASLGVGLLSPETIVSHPPQIDFARLQTYPIGNEADASRTEASPNVAMAVLVGGEASLLNEGSDNAWRHAFLLSSAPFEKRSVLAIGRQAPLGWKDKQIHADVDVPGTPLELFAHLALKLTLNNVSSATMGKMGRLSSNWMAHVDASNKKLIDRSTRLVVELAGVDYETACVALFESIEEMKGWDEARRKTTSPAAFTVEKILRSRKK